MKISAQKQLRKVEEKKRNSNERMSAAASKRPVNKNSAEKGFWLLAFGFWLFFTNVFISR